MAEEKLNQQMLRQSYDKAFKSWNRAYSPLMSKQPTMLELTSVGRDVAKRPLGPPAVRFPLYGNQTAGPK